MIYTVQKVKEIQSGNDKNGKPFTKQKLRLETPDGIRDVLLYCPEWNPPPAEGATIEGEIGKPFREGQLPEFERARKGPYSGRSGAPRDFKADPVKNAAIAAEASQKVAVDVIRLALDTKQDPADVCRQVKAVAESLFEQIQKAMGDAK